MFPNLYPDKLDPGFLIISPGLSVENLLQGWACKGWRLPPEKTVILELTKDKEEHNNRL